MTELDPDDVDNIKAVKAVLEKPESCFLHLSALV